MDCTFDGCDRKIKARKLCCGHYQQALKGSELVPLRTVVRTPQTCDVDGCEDRSKGYGDGKPLCRKHLSRWQYHGDATKLTKDLVRPRGLAAIRDAVANRDRSECWTDWAELPCWVGMGHYGGTITRGYPTMGTSRVMWLSMEADGRPRPEAPANNGLHGCDNTLCWNPDHLRWGTHRDNMSDLHESRNYCKHCAHCNP